LLLSLYGKNYRKKRNKAEIFVELSTLIIGNPRTVSILKVPKCEILIARILVNPLQIGDFWADMCHFVF
jgi:hypothetical protein